MGPIERKQTMVKNPVRRVWLACVVTLAAAFATALPATASTHQRHHRTHHHIRHHSAIPQHNGGDRDADNNGGPSDGDGNV